MKQYLDLVRLVMEEGVRKPSRTGVDTISYFGAFYRVDLSKGFPLLTTKKMEWKSLLYEVLWYLSGENHIRNLQKHTKISKLLTVIIGGISRVLKKMEMETGM
jgi:thymidylate synthase